MYTVQAQMEVMLCQENIKSLRDLLDNYEGQAEIYAEAQASLRTFHGVTDQSSHSDAERLLGLQILHAGG